MGRPGEGPATVVKSLRSRPLHRDLSEAPGGCIDPIGLLPGHPEVTDLQDVLLCHQAVPSRQVPGWGRGGGQCPCSHGPCPTPCSRHGLGQSCSPAPAPGLRRTGSRQVWSPCLPWAGVVGVWGVEMVPGPLRGGPSSSHRWMQHLLSRYSMPAAASPTICSRVFIRRREPSVRRKVRKSPPGGGHMETR